jgi:hypothetical protein
MTARDIVADRELTEDEAAGIAWWNALAEPAREYWLQRAPSGTVAEAWALFQASGEAWALFQASGGEAA